MGHGLFSVVRGTTESTSRMVSLIARTANRPCFRRSDGAITVGESDPQPTNRSCWPIVGGVFGSVSGTAPGTAVDSRASAMSFAGDWRTSTTTAECPPGSLSFSVPTVTVTVCVGFPLVRMSLTSWKQWPAVMIHSGAISAPLQPPLRTPPPGSGMSSEVILAVERQDRWWWRGKARARRRRHRHGGVIRDLAGSDGGERSAGAQDRRDRHAQ
jgi:hypothetical protein